MIERQLEIATPHGATTTFICHPDRDGPHPVVLFLMDAPGIREELRDMARRLGTVGYYVILPNLYYREGVMQLADIPEATRPGALDLMARLTVAGLMSDVDALLAFVDADPAAKAGPMGVVGYCMSGPTALQVAGRHPERVAAAASIYGVSLVTDSPESPHLAARRAKGELYVAAAETDRWAPLEMIESLKTHFKADGVKGEIEIYPGVEHGFGFPQRAAYDKPAAERHWERLFSLFARNLG